MYGALQLDPVQVALHHEIWSKSNSFQVNGGSRGSFLKGPWVRGNWTEAQQKINRMMQEKQLSSPKTNSSPLKIHRSSQRETSLPSIHFQGRLLLVLGGTCFFRGSESLLRDTTKLSVCSYTTEVQQQTPRPLKNGWDWKTIRLPYRGFSRQLFRGDFLLNFREGMVNLTRFFFTMSLYPQCFLLTSVLEKKPGGFP